MAVQYHLSTKPRPVLVFTVQAGLGKMAVGVVMQMGGEIRAVPGVETVELADTGTIEVFPTREAELSSNGYDGMVKVIREIICRYTC